MTQQPNSAGEVETPAELEPTPDVGGDLPDPGQDPTPDVDDGTVVRDEEQQL